MRITKTVLTSNLFIPLRRLTSAFSLYSSENTNPSAKVKNIEDLTLKQSLKEKSSIPLHLLEKRILEQADQLTVELYISIITSIKPKNKTLIALLEVTGKKLLNVVSNDQLSKIIYAYTNYIIPTQDFYKLLIQEVTKRIEERKSYSLMAKAAEGFAKVGITNPLFFKKLEVKTNANIRRFTAKELLQLYRAFSLVQPKDPSLKEKITFNLMSKIGKLNTMEVVEVLKYIKRSHVQVWRAHVNVDMWESVEYKFMDDIDSCSIDEAIDMLECAQAVNYFTQPFIEKAIKRIKNEGYKLSFDQVLRVFSLLVEFRCEGLEEYTKVLEENYENATIEQKLHIQSRLAFYSPDRTKDYKELKDIPLEELSGKSIRDYIFLFTKEASLNHLKADKQVEVIASDISAIEVAPQYRIMISKLITSVLESRDLLRKFKVECQIADSHLNLIDIGIERKKPYISFKKPNNYAVLIENDRYINNMKGKGYTTWEIKKQILSTGGWEIIILKQREINGAKYLESQLAPLYL